MTKLNAVGTIHVYKYKYASRGLYERTKEDCRNMMRIFAVSIISMLQRNLIHAARKFN